MSYQRDKSKGDASDSLVQRLVDGELPEVEYRAVLAGLEEEPGGWRRCALAFLEAQALAQELGSVRRALDVRGGSDGVAKPILAPIAVAGFDIRTLLAVAASFLVAFALGVFVPKFLAAVWQDSPVAGNITTPGMSLDPSGPPGNSRRTGPREVGSLQLVMDGPGGSATAGQVPVYEVGHDVEQYLSAEQPTFGPELIEWLRQEGYDVQHQQQYFPAPLNDGRQIIVPIDGYRITPVSRRF